jgi:hypothetical protein
LTPQRSSACPSRRMTPKLGLLLEAHRLQGAWTDNQLPTAPACHLAG